MKYEPTLVEHGVPKSTVDYMRKHKQGMFSAADKKLVKENNPAKNKAKHEALESKRKEKSEHKKGNSEGKVGNGSRTGVTKDNDNDPISRFHTA